MESVQFTEIMVVVNQMPVIYAMIAISMGTIILLTDKWSNRFKHIKG